MIWRWLVPVVAFATVTLAQTFKSCAESETCNFLRNKPPNPNEFQVMTVWGVSVVNSSIRFNIQQIGVNVLRCTISLIADDIIRLQVDELFDPNRYYLDTALDGEPIPDETPLNWLTQNRFNFTTIWGGDHLLIVHSEPFKIEVHRGNDLVAVFNEDGRLTFDHEGNYRAVGFDINFPLASLGYGLPLHADNLILRQTGIGGEEPYRLYNVDGANYDINSTKALSGAVPVLFAHGPTHSAGVFFHNPYETWVDVDYTRGHLSTHFMVADGIFDAFIMLGPSPSDIYRQYTTLTGVTPLPPIWSLGYHHGAFPGEDAADILDLVSSFDGFQIPLESVFISGQNAPFNWDADSFPNPLQFLQTLASTNRKAVLAVNPFIPADSDYDVFLTALIYNYLILAPTRVPYTANTYIGASSWWDFTQPNGERYFSGLISSYPYTNIASNVAGFWNVLNEPVVVGQEENILPLENVHYQGLYHKDVHNIYSHLMNQATYNGFLNRDSDERRPFVLADSFFAGSQRFAAIYTGNSHGDWGHLAVSYRMCLSASIAGVPFCGSDVGGYNNLVSEELLVRWYQASVWLPLFRSSTIEEGRRPDELSSEARANIKTAIDLRYSLINYFYTLFYEHERFKSSIIKPLFYQYPALPDAHEVENGFIVGDEILLYPITQSNQSTHNVYLPPGDLWYDVDATLVYNGYGFTYINVYSNRIPVFYRGGGIIFRRNGQPKTTADLRGASFTMYVFVPSFQYASGRVYLDDGESYNYKRNEYSYTLVEFQDETITYTPIDADAHYLGDDVVISQYVIYRPPAALKSDGRAPVPVQPEVYDTAADGTAFKDMKINLRKGHNIRIGDVRDQERNIVHTFFD